METGDYERYVVYEFISGIDSGRRFYQPASTHFELENSNLIRKIDKIPSQEMAKKFCQSSKKKNWLVTIALGCLEYVHHRLLYKLL
mgnify:CR=1 FL=1